MKTARYATTFFAGAFLLVAAAPSAAQVDDARWLPFVGCWEPADEAEEAGLLCFTPADRGVEMSSIVAGEIVSSEHLVADGQQRPVVVEGCEGAESVTFSADGRRAFTSSDITCGTDDRPGSGVMAMIAPTRWVDVRAMEIGGENVAWVQVYRLVGPERLAEEGIDDPSLGLEAAIQGSRLVASRDVDVEDVREASEVMATEGVVAWIAAQSDHFQLDGEQIVELADAGVPERVIDVMVAVSYPEHFSVGADQVAQNAMTPSGRRIPLGVGYRGYMMWDPFYSGYSAFGYSRYGALGYNRYGYGNGFGYGPYGYGGYGGFYGPTIVRVERNRPQASNGRAINGRGWTRRAGGDSGGRVARPSGGSGSGGYVGSSGSGGSRGAARGGRKAKPRGGSGSGS